MWTACAATPCLESGKNPENLQNASMCEVRTWRRFLFKRRNRLPPYVRIEPITTITEANSSLWIRLAEPPKSPNKAVRAALHQQPRERQIQALQSRPQRKTKEREQKRSRSFHVSGNTVDRSIVQSSRTPTRMKESAPYAAAARYTPYICCLLFSLHQ